MIFSPEGVVSFEDYEYRIKAVYKMVSNRNHAFGAAEQTALSLSKNWKITRWLMKVLEDASINIRVQAENKKKYLGQFLAQD